MQKLYKLTDKNGMTKGETHWEVGKTLKATGKRGQGLCSDEYLHAYEHPLVAVLMNPIHANIKNPRMWEVEGKVAARDGELKCGARRLKVLAEMPVPVITTEQKARFAIYCAFGRGSEGWKEWARRWLSGEDRSAEAAAEAEAAEAAAEAAWAARAAEAWAAREEAALAAAAALAAEAWAARAVAFPVSQYAVLAMSDDWQSAIAAIEKQGT